MVLDLLLNGWRVKTDGTPTPPYIGLVWAFYLHLARPIVDIINQTRTVATNLIPLQPIYRQQKIASNSRMTDRCK